MPNAARPNASAPRGLVIVPNALIAASAQIAINATSQQDAPVVRTALRQRAVLTARVAPDAIRASPAQNAHRPVNRDTDGFVGRLPNSADKSIPHLDLRTCPAERNPFLFSCLRAMFCLFLSSPASQPGHDMPAACVLIISSRRAVSAVPCFALADSPCPQRNGLSALREVSNCANRIHLFSLTETITEVPAWKSDTALNR